MSHYYATAIHPETGKPTRALYIDGHFGSHRYGVQFEGEDRVWREDELKKAEAVKEGRGQG